MAGIIVGNDRASGTRGIATGAKLMSIKVGTASGAVDVLPGHRRRGLGGEAPRRRPGS
jgi:hypothetical protein